MFHKSRKLYGIVDQEACLKHNVLAYDMVKAFVNAGAEIIQYRNKLDSKNVAEMYFEGILKMVPQECILILNDYPDLAEKYQVWSHLGQTDPNMNLHEPFGRSTHSIHEVKHALGEVPAPEYIGFGSMFTSRTKPEIAPQLAILENVMKLWKKDIVLIGGISVENIKVLPKAANIYYAVINDCYEYGDNLVKIEKRITDLVRESRFEAN